MRKIVFILSLFLCICHTNRAENNKIAQNSYSYVEDGQPKFHITSSDHTIKISGIKSKSYLMVFDTVGRNVFKGTVSDSVVIPIRSKGVFIIRIQSETEISTQKILVP